MKKGPILLVEDDDDVREALDLFLTEENYLILPYESGKKAIGDIEDGLQYKIAFVDLNLPWGVGGDAVIEASKRFNPRVPVYCVSGYNHKPPLADGNISKLHLGLEVILETINRHLK